MLTSDQIQEIVRTLSFRHPENYVDSDMMVMEKVAHEYAHLLALKTQSVPFEDYKYVSFTTLNGIVESEVNTLTSTQSRDHNELLANAIVHAAFTGWVPEYNVYFILDSAISNLSAFMDGSKVESKIEQLAVTKSVQRKAMILRNMLSESLGV